MRKRHLCAGLKCFCSCRDVLDLSETRSGAVLRRRDKGAGQKSNSHLGDNTRLEDVALVALIGVMDLWRIRS